MKNCFLFYILIIVSAIACQEDSKINKKIIGSYKSLDGQIESTLELKEDGTYEFFQLGKLVHLYYGEWEDLGNQIILYEGVNLSKYLSIVNYSKNKVIDTLEMIGEETIFFENDNLTLEAIEEIIPSAQEETFNILDTIKGFSNTLIINMSDEVVKALPQFEVWIDSDTVLLPIVNNQIIINKKAYISSKGLFLGKFDNLSQLYYTCSHNLNFKNKGYQTSITNIFEHDSIQISLKSPLPKRSKSTRAIIYTQKDSLLVTESEELVMPNQLIKVK